MRVGPRRLAVAAIGAVVMLTATGCTANEAFFFDMPESATKEGNITYDLWHGSWIAAWLVGIVTWALMLWAMFAYRKRKNAEGAPEQTRYNIPIEIMYTVVPLVMILGMFWFTARDQSEILTVENDQTQTVGVNAWRWSWGFNYVEQDVYDAGTPDAVPTLWLPVNEKTRFELMSPDVIHSFWVPDFLFKMDVIPGKTNVFELTPDKEGTYAGKCAELCGTYHSAMLFNVKVVSRAEFDAHMAELKKLGQTGKVQTGHITNEGQVPGEKLL